MNDKIKAPHVAEQQTQKSLCSFIKLQKRKPRVNKKVFVSFTDSITGKTLVMRFACLSERPFDRGKEKLRHLSDKTGGYIK